MVTFEHVSKLYHPDVVALQDVSFHIEAGEFVTIVGQSGAGKTTLAKLLIAEESPTSGRIVIGGWDVTQIKSYQVPALRRQIGVVFQDFKLLPRKTVYENVAFALEVVGATRERIRDIVPHVLKIVNVEHKADRFPAQISGGEQQRVVIARALVHRPKLLLADEPTGNLDTIHTNEIMELLLRINAFGTTVLLVTHNREMVNTIRRRVLTLHNGALVSDHKHGKYTLPV